MLWEVPVYNVVELGPVVPLNILKRLMQDLSDTGFGGNKMARTVRMVGEIADIAAHETPVRLTPSVPGGGVEPFLASIEMHW